MDKDVFTSTAELQTGLHPSAWVPSGVAAGLLALSESPGLFWGGPQFGGAAALTGDEVDGRIPPGEEPSDCWKPA